AGGSPAAPAHASCPSRHWPTRRPTQSGPMPAPAVRALHPGWGAATSPFLDPQSAGRGPFLDPGEIVISAVAVGPHRQVQRGVGLILILEGADQRLQLGPGLSGRGVRRLRLVALLELELEDAFFARRIVAAQADIDELAHGRAGVDVGKTALAQDRGFQRELRRQAHPDLLAGRRLAGLVVENGITAALAPFDAVGTGGEAEAAPIVERDRDLAASFRGDRLDHAAPRRLPFAKPACD